MPGVVGKVVMERMTFRMVFTAHSKCSVNTQLAVCHFFLKALYACSLLVLSDSWLICKLVVKKQCFQLESLYKMNQLSSLE